MTFTKKKTWKTQTLQETMEKIFPVFYHSRFFVPPPFFSFQPPFGTFEKMAISCSLKIIWRSTSSSVFSIMNLLLLKLFCMDCEPVPVFGANLVQISSGISSRIPSESHTESRNEIRTRFRKRGRPQKPEEILTDFPWFSGKKILREFHRSGK